MQACNGAWSCCRQELHACLKRQQQRYRSAEEPAWSEVVVDLLLSLLALNVHLLRSVVRSVFTLLAPLLSPQALSYAFQVCVASHSYCLGSMPSLITRGGVAWRSGYLMMMGPSHCSWCGLF